MHNFNPNHWLCSYRPYAIGRALLDLLECSNYNGEIINTQGRSVSINKNQLRTSELFLAERWGWKIAEVNNYLLQLQQEQFISFIQSKTEIFITVYSENIEPNAKLRYGILSHPLWVSGPFCEGQAYDDFRLRASNKPEEGRFQGRYISLNENQLITSVEALAKRWGWPIEKLTKILNHFEYAELLVYQAHEEYIIITMRTELIQL